VGSLAGFFYSKNNMIFLNKEQVQQLNYKECKKQVKLLEKTYKFDKDIPKDAFPILDDIVDTYLYLTDRIANYEDARYTLLTIEE
jgi:hypothetical protein